MQTGIAYFGTRDRDHVRRDLDEIVAAGCTYVVHTLPEYDVMYHADDMRAIVELTRAAGLGVWLDPWGVAGIFGGEAFSRFVAAYPQEHQVASTGVSLPAACPNRPATRAFLNEWIATASALAPDVLFWDEPHFYVFWEERDRGLGPSGWACHCGVCRDLFQQEVGHSLPATLDAEVEAWRTRCLHNLLGDLTAEGKRVAPQVRQAICMLPLESWETWHTVAALPSLDIIGTDPYWAAWQQDLDEFVNYYSQGIATLAQAHGKDGQIWIQAYRIPAGREPELARAANLAVAAGIRDIATWSFGGGRNMSHLRSADPDRVWAVLRELYTGLRQQDKGKG